MILLLQLSLIVLGSALAMSLAALSYYEAEREIKQLSARRVRVSPDQYPPRPRRRY